MWLSKKILVPTDFGESSKAARTVALELAQRFQVPLVLMHTFGVPVTMYPETPVLPMADYVRSIEKAASVTLEREAQAVRDRGVEITTVLKMGTAWEDILELVKELDVGLIVMGTHGRRGLPRALLGSVAEKVVRLSPIPVLIVHHAPDQESATTSKPLPESRAGEGARAGAGEKL